MGNLNTGVGQEPAADQSLDGAAEQNVTEQPQKTKFEQRMEEAKTPEEALSLAKELHQELINTRNEAKNRRLSMREVEAELAKLREDKKQRDLAELSEIEKLRAENEDYQKKLREESEKRSEAEALRAFSDANNPNLLLSHWKSLSEEQKSKTSIDDWVESMKSTDPYLFKSAPPAGGNPRHDGGGNPPVTTSIKRPTNRAEAAETVKKFKEKYKR